ncbi:MAG: Ig-like domain-containing protein [Rikenellaceae bacterium]
MKKIYSIFYSLLSLLVIVSCEKEYPVTNTPQADQTISVSKSSVSLLFDNNQQCELQVTAEATVKWRLTSSQTWLTLSTEESGNTHGFVSGRGEGLIYLFASAYQGDGGEPRVANLTLEDGTTLVTVSQFPSGEITTSLPELTFGKDEQTRTIAIEVKDNSKEWTVTPTNESGVEVDWVDVVAPVTLRAGVSGKGACDVEVSVDANTTGVERTARIMLDDELLFEIKQTNTDFVAVASIEMTDVTLANGVVSPLETTVLPANATDKYVTYVSSDSNVVSVDALGNVTAKAIGEAVITVTAGDNTKGAISQSCTVTVIDAIPVTAISIPSEALTIGIGDEPTEMNSTVVITPSNASIQEVVWSVDKPDVVTIDPTTGAMTALRNGTVVVTATSKDGGFTDTRTVYVIRRVVSIEITGESALSLNGKTTLTANITPNDASNLTVTWTSSNPAVATIDESGVVTGLSGGKTTITAKSNGKDDVSATFELTVEAVALESISVADINLPIGRSADILVTYNPTNTSYKGVEFTTNSGDITIADGKISIDEATAVVAGTIITVTATSIHDATKTVDFTVTIQAAPIEYKVGDPYPDKDGAIGIVYWVDPADNTKGKVFSIEHSNKGCWGVPGTYIGANNTTDGVFNTQLLLSSALYTANATGYPLFKWFKDNYVDTKPGDLTWGVPSIVELKELMAFVFGIDDTTWVNTPSQQKPTVTMSKANLDAFNAIYKTAADTKLKGYDSFAAAYWNSTEGNLSGFNEVTGKDNVLIFSTGLFSTKANNKNSGKPSDNAQLRPIAKFGY